MSSTLPRDSASRHAQVTGSPGQRARDAGLVRAAWPLLAVCFAAGYLVRAVLPGPHLGATAAGFLLLALAMAMAGVISMSRQRIAAYIKGARGEERVARELGFLPAAYRVYHGLALRQSAATPPAEDFDHVVVGPTGVFVIETKNWDGRISIEDGRILYDGRDPDRPPLEQAKAGANALRRALAEACGTEIAVRPLVCFAGDGLAADSQGAAGVIVCNARSVNAVIRDDSEPPLPADAQEKAVAFLDRCAG